MRKLIKKNLFRLQVNCLGLGELPASGSFGAWQELCFALVTLD